jgi:hypothetical protein
MVHAKGYRVWHRSDIRSNKVPRSGIDTDARWGFARTKGWIFGYKIHIVSSTGRMVIPLSASVTTANVPDNQMYQELTGQLAGAVRYIVADAGYDDWKLYDYTIRRGARLVCPIRRYRHTRGDRLELVRFYRSRKGQRIYGTRSVSIEPLIQCVKDTFGTSSVPEIGFDNVTSHLLMCVFVYQIAIYYNCMVGSDNPRCVKHMLGN